MPNDKTHIKGKVAWRVLAHTEEGLGKLKNLRGLFDAGEISKEERDGKRQLILDNPIYSTATVTGENHNIVTNEGDAMIADIMSQTPARVKVDSTNGHIEVGTGFVSEVKTALSCTTTQDSPEIMDATYPKQKGAFGAADDNVTQYRATFEAGDLTGNPTIDEAALLNNATVGSADCLAYAEVTPNVTVAVTDTLQMDWEITYVGA